ncbi:MAG: cytochrome c [Pseudomonadales bacterium]|nr:cytochrome c [Pseudomonadales bacterium]
MKAIGKTLVVLFSVMFLGPFPLFAGVEEGDAGVQFAGMDDGWNVPEEARRQENPIRYDVGSVMQGKSLFDKHCLVCHGYWGEGNGIVGLALDNQPANLLKLAGKQSEGTFAWKIANGKGDMPAFGEELDEDQIWTLVNFVDSLENEEGTLVDE